MDAPIAGQVWPGKLRFIGRAAGKTVNILAGDLNNSSGGTRFWGVQQDAPGPIGNGPELS